MNIINFIKKQDLFIVINSLVFGILLTFAIPIDVPDFLAIPVLNVLFYLVVIVLLSVLICYLSVLLLQIKTGKKNTIRSNVFPVALIYCFPCLFIFSLYLAAFYPGIMSMDSITQWKQLISFSFNDFHPVFHTLLNWLITRVWLSPAAISVFQILLFSFIVAYGMVSIERLGVSRRFLICVALFYSLHPLNGIYSVTLWKDVPYSLFLMWLTILLFEIMYSDGIWLESVRNKLIVSFVLIFVFLLRHNGFAPFIITLIGLFCLYGKYWRHILLISIVSLSVIVLIKWPLYERLNVHRAVGGMTTCRIHHLAAIVVSDKPINDEDRKVLETVLPTEDWKQYYSPYTANNLVLSPRFNGTCYWKEDIRKVVFDTWLRLFMKYPHIVLKHTLLNNSLVWRIRQFPDAYTMSICLLLDPNEFGLKMTPLLPGLHESLKKQFLDILYNDKNMLKTFIYRPALFLYTALFFAIIFVYKNKKIKGIITIFPLIGNSLTLFLFTPGQDTRYLYSSFLIAPLLMLLCFANHNSQLPALKDGA
ncbi:MAG: hypothetical protein GY749_12665 [Desulfobacteraceae bacterium]|nr:hypothetical protein [Desulfobacteraceae bacterium]